MARTNRTPRSSREIGEEIAKLQSELEKARQAEKAEVVAKIRVAVEHYGITAAEIFSATGKSSRKAKAGVKPKAKVAAPVKFKDDAGNTWSGFGRKPKWFADLIAAGKTEDELRA